MPRVLTRNLWAAQVTSDAGGEAIYTASAAQKVEAGPIELYVGGGQPDFYEGHLSGKVTVSAAAALSSCH